MRSVWRWSMPLALAVAGVFLVIDLAFFAANLLKIMEGGWIPLLLGAILFTVMVTWRSGIDAIRQRASTDEEPPDAFLRRLEEGRIPRVPGTAVFLTRTEAVVPHVVVRHVTQFKALPEVVIGLTVRFEEVPRVAADERATVHKVEAGLWHVTVRYGFVEIPNVTQALAAARDQGCPLDLDGAVFFAAHDEVVRCERHPRMGALSRGLFAFLYRNALRAPDRLDLPAERYLELSRQVEV
jgi:KUP system potassium uptake protein